MLHNIESNLLSLNTFIRTHYKSMSGFRAQVEREFNSLKGKFDFMNQSVSSLGVCLQEHKEQTAAELSHLQTSLTCIHSKLDTLTNTTASDHQQITESVSDVECRVGMRIILYIHLCTGLTFISCLPLLFLHSPKLG